MNRTTSRPGVLPGKAAHGDWTTDAPVVRRRITTADLPQPYETKSVENDARLVTDDGSNTVWRVSYQK